MTLNKEIILRELAGEYILIPTGSAVLKLRGMATLSESGYLLWNALQQGCEEPQLVDALLAEYEIDRESAAADVAEFLQQLRELGILMET